MTPKDLKTTKLTLEAHAREAIFLCTVSLETRNFDTLGPELMAIAERISSLQKGLDQEIRMMDTTKAGVWPKCTNKQSEDC